MIHLMLLCPQKMELLGEWSSDMNDIEYAGRTCQHRTRKQITCGFEVMKTMELPNSGAGHEQSHDKHACSKNLQNRICKIRR